MQDFSEVQLFSKCLEEMTLYQFTRMLYKMKEQFINTLHLYEHFCDSEHSGFLNDVSITFIDKTDLANPLQREKYWKHILKTFASCGLNIKENVQLFDCFFAFTGIGIVCVVVAALTLIAYHCELHVLLLALWKLLLLLRCKRLLLC